MFKLVVLSALLAVVAAKPGYLTGAHTLAYAAPAAIAVPAATSHTYRTDIISKPVVHTYAAPVVTKTVIAAPAVAYAAAPVVHKTLAYSAPLAYAAHAAPLAYAGGYAW